MNDERLREGFEHLQAAALELIAAARAFLDVAEDLVKDPVAAVALASVVAPHVPKPRPAEPAETAPRVQRITVV